jgi:hypothetical protein
MFDPKSQIGVDTNPPTKPKRPFVAPALIMESRVPITTRVKTYHGFQDEHNSASLKQSSLAS